jgi:hypothetical protein
MAAWCMQAAHADAPALAQNVVCESGHVLVGEVVAVESLDCKLRSENWCAPRGLMVVQVRIERVLKTVALPEYLQSRFAVHAGETLPMYVSGFSSGANRYPPLLREEDAPGAMTTEWLKGKLVGERLVFMAGSQPSGIADGPTLLIGGTLPIAAVPWAEEVLGNVCGPHGRPR